MTSTSPSAFLLSVLLHGLAIALAIFLSFSVGRQDPDTPKIIELVAGEGDNFAATEAPALGVEGGVKLTLPEAPAPRPEPRVIEPTPAPAMPVEAPPVAPAPPKPAPVAAPPPTPAPSPKATQAANEAVPNFKKKIQYEIVRGDAKAKLQLRREREAEAKRLAEEKKRMSKEEFDRAQKSKGTAGSTTKSSTTKVAKIDSEGIAKGVVGGSTNNKVGGAGGKALKSDVDDVLDSYYAMFKQRLRTEFEAPPGLSDSLKASIEVRSNPDGSLSGARISRSSGSRDFDRAVLEAISRVRMPPRPPGRKAETIEFVFNMHERDEG